MPHEEIQPLFLEFSGFVPGFQCKHGFLLQDCLLALSEEKSSIKLFLD